MKLVLIEWVDSHSCNGWHDIEDISEASELTHCRSVGWLLVDGKDCKVLVSHLAGEGRGQSGCGDMAIPVRAITKMTVLRKG